MNQRNEFAMEFDTGNDAFADDRGGEEVARILCAVAKQARDGFTSGLINDINGNRVGSWGVRYAADGS